MQDQAKTIGLCLVTLRSRSSIWWRHPLIAAVYYLEVRQDCTKEWNGDVYVW